MVTHPGAGNWRGTLANALLDYDDNLSKLDRAGIVHRLDKNTSGLLVVAKNSKSQKNLVDQLQHHLVKREYSAIVYGHMISGGTGRKAFTSDRIHYNYSLSNDGGRLVPDPPSNECSGGFNTHVDDGTGYSWKGNITRNDSNRHYNNDGSTDNHTCWFLARTWN